MDLNSKKQNTKSKKKRRIKTIGLVAIFLVGFLIAIYPMISQLYYRQVATRAVNEFDTKKGELSSEEIAERILLADAYNRTLDPGRMMDPFTDIEKKGIAEYARMLEVAEKIGHIEIPKINEDLPIYAGTSDDVLQKGVGHLEGSSLPVGGYSTHAVLTAHRGLPNAKLFRELDKLEVGDVFFMHNIKETLCYKVDLIQTVEPTNFRPVLVEEGKDYMTLLTCTPYMINSHRLLVRGHRVPFKEDDLTPAFRAAPIDMTYKEYFRIALAFILFFGLIYLIEFSTLRKAKKKFRSLKKKLNESEKKDE